MYVRASTTFTHIHIRRTSPWRCALYVWNVQNLKHTSSMLNVKLLVRCIFYMCYVHSTYNMYIVHLPRIMTDIHMVSRQGVLMSRKRRNQRMLYSDFWSA